MRYIHVLRVLHSSSAGPNWAETGYRINDISWFVNVVAFLAPNSKTLSVLKLPLNLQPRWIDFVCQQRHRPWKSGVLCLAKCTSSSNYTWWPCLSFGVKFRRYFWVEWQKDPANQCLNEVMDDQHDLELLLYTGYTAMALRCTRSTVKQHEDYTAI